MPVVDPKWIRNPNDTRAVDEGCWFDDEAGEFIIDFIEAFCRQSKGEWGGQRLKLMDWQKDFIMRLFGWKRPDGTRRFRSAYKQVAKKNGKSTEISGIALACLIADGEPGAEVHVNACDRAQAGIVHDEAEKMVKASPDLDGILTCTPSKKTITHLASNSVMRANSADVPSKDGLNAHLTIFDELHRQKTWDQWNVFKHAGAARRQPLRISITTAGHDRDSVCYAEYSYSKGVNSGDIIDTRHLAVIYEPDPDDDLSSPDTWRKANPSLGITISLEDFRRDYEEALKRPSEYEEFLRLRLNMWTQAHSRFLARDKWDACGQATLNEIALFKQDGYAGLDLSNTNDLTAFVVVFRVGSKVHVVCRFWLPQETAEERARKGDPKYIAWARAGFLTLIPGPVIDYDFVRHEILELAARYKLRRIFIDPYNATSVATKLIDDKLPVEYMRQGYISMNAPVKELERLTVAELLEHYNNPILSWMCDNTEAVKDPAGNLKLDKSKAKEKIDGMVALAMAVGAMLADGSGPKESVYKTRGAIIL